MSAPAAVMVPGKCRACGCDETNPCVIVGEQGQMFTCQWIDQERTLCSNLSCVARTDLDELLKIYGLE
jgi:hypothetical protein